MARGRIGGREGRAALRALAEKGEGQEDEPFLLLALGIADDRAAAPFVRRRFREEQRLRAPAALALGLLRDREAAPEVRSLAFGKGLARVRGPCITALGLMGDAESAPEMRRVLDEEADPVLRLDAAVALGILGDGEAVGHLQRLARRGGSVHVRSHSCYFLGMVGTEPAARTLLEALGDDAEKMVVRMHAVAGLGLLADRSPVPILASLNADGDYRLPIDPLREILSFL
jgi:HEAT repeat protein